MGESVPYITKAMLLNALKYSKKSVSNADLQKYMRYKRTMERRLGMDVDKDMKEGSAPAPSVSASAPVAASAPAPSGGAAQPTIEADDDDLDDIYDDDDEE